MTDQLKLTIASGVVHGLRIYDEVSKKAYNLSEYWNKPLPDEFHHQFGKTFVEQCLHDRKLKPMMHPISKLTEPILPDGKIPIVELLKMQNKNFFNSEMSERYNEIEIEVVPNYIAAYVKFLATIQIKLWFNDVYNWPTWITDKLDAWHINYRGVDSVDIIND